MHAQTPRTALWSVLSLAGSVVAITVLHYITSLHSVLLHEVFQRLYYLPIVVAAVLFGWRAALATSALASILYVPHIAMNWHAWPVLQVDQYGEVLIFNLVGLVTGALADRMRLERNRYREVATDLERAHAELLARTDERLRMDRLVMIGRLASGLAHEIRNPLGSLLGCLEILAPTVRQAAPGKEEFLAIATDEVARLETVVSEFLEFAHPAPPSRQPTDLRELVGSAVRLAKPELARRGLEVEVQGDDAALMVALDTQQLQRAFVNLLLDPLAPGRCGVLRVSLDSVPGAAQVCFEVPGVRDAERLSAGLFEPFPDCGNGHGLSLAIARRLIENQGGTARAHGQGTTLRYTIELPLQRPSAIDAVVADSPLLARSA